MSRKVDAKDRQLVFGKDAYPDCLSLREDMFNRLRVFHNTCVRSMCRVTMHHVIRHHITDAQLRERVGVKDLDHYYNTRLLRWVGHVARMNTNRLPRKLLTCWVRNKRPVGAPQMTYGRTVNKALNSGIPRHHGQLCHMEGDRREESFMAKENTRMTGRVILPCAHTHTFFPHTAHTLITQ